MDTNMFYIFIVSLIIFLTSYAFKKNSRTREIVLNIAMCSVFFTSAYYFFSGQGNAIGIAIGVLAGFAFYLTKFTSGEKNGNS